MQDNNDATQQTDAPEPQDAPQEQPQVEEQAPSQEEAQVEQVETPAPEPEEPDTQPEYDPSDVDTAQYLRQMQQQQTVQPDDDGYIDPNAYRQSILQEVEQKLQFQEQERRAWEAIESKYPEVKNDKELRDLIDAQRFADVAKGGAGNLSKIAQNVVGKMKSYQQQGKVQAQVSEKVQKSAGLQTATANNVDTNKDSDLIERMSRGDQSAQEELISSWLADGKL